MSTITTTRQTYQLHKRQAEGGGCIRTFKTSLSTITYNICIVANIHTINPTLKQVGGSTIVTLCTGRGNYAKCIWKTWRRPLIWTYCRARILNVSEHTSTSKLVFDRCERDNEVLNKSLSWVRGERVFAKLCYLVKCLPEDIDIVPVTAVDRRR